MHNAEQQENINKRRSTAFRPPPANIFSRKTTEESCVRVSTEDFDDFAIQSRSKNDEKLQKIDSDHSVNPEWPNKSSDENERRSRHVTCCALLKGCLSQAGRYRGCCCLSLSTFVLCLAICGMLDGLFMVVNGLASQKVEALTVGAASAISTEFGDFLRSANILSDESIMGDVDSPTLGPNRVYHLVTGALVFLLSALVAVGVVHKMSHMLGFIVILLVVALTARLLHDVYLWVFAGQFHWINLTPAIVAYTLRGIQVDAIYSLFRVMRQGGSGFEHKSVTDLALTEEKEPLKESMIDSGMVRI